MDGFISKIKSIFNQGKETNDNQRDIDERAIGICHGAAWSMGQSLISIVHIPEQIYSDMYDELLKLNHTKRYNKPQLVSFSIKGDQTTGDDYDEIKPVRAISTAIDYAALRTKIREAFDCDVNSGQELNPHELYMSNLVPQIGVFYKGMAVHTLIREGVYPITYETFVGRARYLDELCSLRFY